MHVVKMFFILIIAMSVVMIGCNKDDNPTTTDPAKAQQRVDQANQIMYPHLAQFISSNGNDTAAMNMSSAYALYVEALSYDPNNNEAHFGAALTGSITMMADPTFRSMLGQLSLPSTTVSLFKGGKSVPALGMELKTRIQNRLLSFTKLQKPEDFLKAFSIPNTSQPPSYYQNIIETKVLPGLNLAIAHLQHITTDPNFAFYIQPQDLGGSISDSIRIDLAEVYIMLGICQVAYGGASSFVTYNVDYDMTNAADIAAAWELTDSFLHLRLNGAQHMRDVRSNFISAATTVQSGITYLRGKTGYPGIDPLPYRPDDEPRLTEVYLTMDSLKALLSGPFVIYDDFNRDSVDEPLTVNFVNFFDNAVINLKTKLPSYTVGTPVLENGKYSAVLTWTAITFSNWIIPDPTYNNFLPGMTSDAIFKSTFGIDGTDWKQTVTVH